QLTPPPGKSLPESLDLVRTSQYGSLRRRSVPRGSTSRARSFFLWGSLGEHYSRPTAGNVPPGSVVLSAEPDGDRRSRPLRPTRVGAGMRRKERRMTPCHGAVDARRCPGVENRCEDRSPLAPKRARSRMLDRKKLAALFEEIALPHLDAVYRFALHLCGNEGDAQDLTQESFHQAFRKFHQFEQGTNCKAWLFRIARNGYVDRIRQRA